MDFLQMNEFLKKKSFLLFHKKLKMLFIKISFSLQESLQQFFQKLKLSIVANRNVSFYRRTILQSITVFQFYR